jgi:hypothetical protein
VEKSRGERQARPTESTASARQNDMRGMVARRDLACTGEAPSATAC